MTSSTASEFFRYALEDLNAPHTGIGDIPNAKSPLDLHLSQPYPNPFNSTTILTFTVVQANVTSLVIYNIEGRRVKTIFDQWRVSGTYRVAIDASDLSSGLYFALLTSGKHRKITKMVLLK